MRGLMILRIPHTTAGVLPQGKVSFFSVKYFFGMVRFPITVRNMWNAVSLRGRKVGVSQMDDKAGGSSAQPYLTVAERENFAVRLKRDTGSVPNPESAVAHAEAIRKVLLYLIVDALDLSGEEEVWVGWQLDSMLGEVADIYPTSVPLAARMEMLKGVYSAMLEERRASFNGKRSVARLWNKNVTHASSQDWAESVLETLQFSYDLTSDQYVRFLGKLTSMFDGLGVGIENNPRGASYIPSGIKQRMRDNLPASR